MSHIAINLGNDQNASSAGYLASQNAADLAFLTGYTDHLRIAMPQANATIPINNLRQLCLDAKAKGFYVSWGVTAGQDSGVYTNNWYTSGIIAQAKWCQANNIDELHVGNEEDWNCFANGAFTSIGKNPTSIRNDIKNVVAQVKAVYSGKVSYCTAEGMIDGWISEGIGGLDKIYFNIYDDVADGTFQRNINKCVAAFGAKFCMSEWSAQHGYDSTQYNHGSGAAYDSWFAQEILNHNTIIRNANVDIACLFTYRYPGSGWAFFDNNQLRPGFAQAFTGNVFGFSSGNTTGTTGGGTTTGTGSGGTTTTGGTGATSGSVQTITKRTNVTPARKVLGATRGSLGATRGNVTGASSTVTASNILAENNYTGLSAYTTSSITPVTGDLYLLSVVSRQGTGDNPPQPTVTGGGLAWVPVNTSIFDNTGGSQRRLTVFRAMGAGAAGALTIDFGGIAQTACQWSLDQFAGVDTGGSSGSSAVVQSAVTSLPGGNGTTTPYTLTVTLAAFATSANATFGAFAAGDPTTSVTLTPGSGFTGLSAHDTAQNPIHMATEFKSTNDTSVDYVWGNVGGGLELGGIAVEIKAASGGRKALS